MCCLMRKSHEVGLALVAVSERTGGGFRSRIPGGVIALVAFIVFGLALVGYGAYTMWVIHFGTPARVTLMECRGGRSSSTLSDCSASWSQADGTQRTVTVHAVPRDQAYARPPATVDVGVRGDQAYMTSSSDPLHMMLFGTVLAVVGVFGLWRHRTQNQLRRRSVPPRSDDPGMPRHRSHKADPKLG